MAPETLPPPVDLAALERYVTRECNSTEQHAVEQVLHARPALAQAVDEIRARVLPTSVRHTMWDPHGALAEFRRMVEAERNAVSSKERRSRTSRFDGARRARWPFALGILAMLALGGAITTYLAGHRLTTTTRVASRVYTTVASQRATITLADGSSVSLAPMTTLRVTGRDVELHGEAVFTVTRHQAEPFTVVARNARTQVLGTTFAVRAYDGDPTVRVVVAEGRVATHVIGAAGRPAILNAGEMVDVTTAGDTRVTQRDITSFFAWTTGRLTFEDASVTEIMTELQRWYGLTFRISDPSRVPPRHTVTFDHDNPESVVSVLSLLLHARAERVGNIVTFYPR